MVQVNRRFPELCRPPEEIHVCLVTEYYGFNDCTIIPPSSSSAVLTDSHSPQLGLGKDEVFDWAYLFTDCFAKRCIDCRYEVHAHPSKQSS